MLKWAIFIWSVIIISNQRRINLWSHEIRDIVKVLGVVKKHRNIESTGKHASNTLWSKGQRSMSQNELPIWKRINTSNMKKLLLLPWFMTVPYASVSKLSPNKTACQNSWASDQKVINFMNSLIEGDKMWVTVGYKPEKEIVKR